jgi:XRE family transcriptional regulator, master regulator for biofilm formation
MLGERIKRLRIEKGLSLIDLARIAGVSKSYLSQIERGKQNNPSLQFLQKIAIPLETSLEYLLEEIEDQVNAHNTLDSEWQLLIQKAIQNGIDKEDFKEYLNFLKYQKWRNTKKDL